MQYVPFLLPSATLNGGQGLKGNSSRFANHSCAPNCRMIRYRLADFDEWQIGLFSSTDIKRGSELTCAFTSSHVEATAHRRADDYGWVTFASLAEEDGQQVPTEPVSQPCHCGAETCRGTLGGKKKAVDAKNKGKAKAKQEKKLAC
jgi:SET domain-containing protein